MQELNNSLNKLYTWQGLERQENDYLFKSFKGDNIKLPIL